MLGRTPDYLYVILTACAAAAEFFGGNRPEFARNAVSYHEYVRENDLTLAHTLVNVRLTRSSQGTASTDDEVALHVTVERPDGIVVNGALVLATLGPLSDEILVFPSTVLRRKPPAHWTAGGIQASIPTAAMTGPRSKCSSTSWTKLSSLRG